MTSSEIISAYSSPTLAYIGDALYELMVRRYLLDTYGSNGRMHAEAKKYVSSAAQSELVGVLEPHLTEAEAAVVRRGRNSKPKSRPKNADAAKYHSATGFEALWGYLFLLEDYTRIGRLFNIITENRLK